MRFIIASLLLLLLNACAVSTKPIPPDHAREVPAAQILGPELLQPSGARTVPVIFMREAGYVGSLMGTLVVVDGKYIAQLKRKQKVTAYLSPGDHLFTIGYLKHPDSRPLTQKVFTVQPGSTNVVSLHLLRGENPVIVTSFSHDLSKISAVAATDEPAYTLPACSGSDTPVSPQRAGRIALVDGRMCLMPGSAHLVGKEQPSWKDLENLEDYADPTEVASLVDTAIRAADTSSYLRGVSGHYIDEKRRYVLTRGAGWIDLAHVAGCASNPLIYIPGMSQFAGWTVEIAQIFGAPMSALVQEDLNGNRIGSNAALKNAYTFGRAGSKGKIVQAMIQRYQPLNQAEALSYFGVILPPAPQRTLPR